MDVCAVLSGTGSGKRGGGLCSYRLQFPSCFALGECIQPLPRAPVHAGSCSLRAGSDVAIRCCVEVGGLACFQGQRAQAGAEEAPCEREGKPPYYEGDRHWDMLCLLVFAALCSLMHGLSYMELN